MAEEAVYQAQGFGNDDFRLGISYCDLGDAEKANKKYARADEAYKKSVAVLEAAIKVDADQQKKSLNAGANGKDAAMYQLQYKLSSENLANTLAQEADLYTLQERNQDAANCYEKAVIIYSSMLTGTIWHVDDSPMGQELVQCELGLAQAYTALKNFEQACAAYKKALELTVSTNCPEFLLREIRDDYLKLLVQLGKNREAQQLIADAQYSELTLEGSKAMYANDYPKAEALFKQAYLAAQQSIFSQRRLMRSLCNLQMIYLRQKKYAEAEQTFNLAESMVRTRGLRYDRDYDVMLNGQLEDYIQTKRGELALKASIQQSQFRLMRFGPSSVQFAENLALRGQAEFLCHNIQAAEKAAQQAYKLLVEHYLNNRRAKLAMDNTADLMVLLQHPDQAATFIKQFVQFDLRNADDPNSQLAGHQTNVFMIYWRFRDKEKCLQAVKDLIVLIDKYPEQRVNAMPYLILIQSCALGYDWFDVAEPATVAGQAILHKELASRPLESTNAMNWNKDLAKMQAHFGHAF